MTKEIENATKLLRSHGYSVYPSKLDPNVGWLIRVPLHNGRYDYSFRWQRLGRWGTFRSKQDTEVAKINMGDLKWEPAKDSAPIAQQKQGRPCPEK